jgi:hypothetical protein
MAQDDRAWDWAGQGTSHVDFARDEKVSLNTERLLGHGVSGSVHEAACNGKYVA